jgi:uncharacterized protein YjbJ (UPF0337 family)
VTEGEGEAMANKASSAAGRFQSQAQTKVESAATQAKSAVKSALDD